MFSYKNDQIPMKLINSFPFTEAWGHDFSLENSPLLELQKLNTIKQDHVILA